MSEAGPSQWPFSNRSIETPGASVATHVSVAKIRKRIVVSDPSKSPACRRACRATELFSRIPPPSLPPGTGGSTSLQSSPGNDESENRRVRRE